MTMADFFTVGISKDQSKTFFPKDSQPNMGQDDIEYYLIGAGHPGRHIEMMREVYRVGADTGKEMIEHEGQEGGVIISGQLELTIADTVQILNPGDGYYFDCLQPHRFRNVGNDDLYIISANSPANF
jgi:mannose-6-phosphate isomerase-like protein (cupin superfamily)